jgi:hypothetical protein
MDHLTTPSGVYPVAKLKALAKSIYNRGKSTLVTPTEIYHDLVVFLLEGQTLKDATVSINMKYRTWETMYNDEEIEHQPRAEAQAHFPHPGKAHMETQLQSLNDSDKFLVKMRKMGKTYDDIANYLGVKASRLRKRFQRLQRRLRGGK